MDMRILVLGAGATGGYFGARLLQAGADVSFLVRPARAAQLRAQGLALESPHGGFRARVSALTREELRGAWDLVVLSCKAYDLDSAIDSVAPAVGPGSVVLPLLNGVAHYEALDACFGAGRVAGGCCHLAVQLGAAGEIRHLNAVHRITFGARGPGVAQRRALERLAALFHAAPVDVRFVENAMQDCWEKYAFIAGLAASTCLMRAAVGDIAAAEHGREIVLEMFRVCAATAGRSGFPLRPGAHDEATATLTDPDSALTASMLRDLEAGRRIESEHIVGDMLRRAEAAGVEPGVLRVAYAHLQAREARRARESRRPPV